MAVTDVGENFNELHLIKNEWFKEQDPEDGRFDVIFEVEGKLLYAHKLMLTLVSDTFDAMLSERWMKSKDKPIKIQDYSYDNFNQFITFLYIAKCELTDENIFDMVDMAEFYGVDLFKAYCQNYLTEMEIDDENIFQLLDMVDKYSMNRLKHYALIFVLGNFQSFIESEGFLNVSKFIVKEVINSIKNKVKPENLFQTVYKWCEKQAIDKQAADPNLNLNDSIKADISDFLPCIRFYEMELDFLLEFIVPKGFIFSSYDELSKILCDRKSRRKIKVTNDRGQALHGYIIDKHIFENIESLNLSTSCRGYDTWCHWETKFTLPSTPSPIKKRNGKWYLNYFRTP